MDSYIKYSAVAGAIISIITCLLVIIEILSIKYKDFANKLILALVSVDCLMAITIFMFLLPMNIILCSFVLYISFYLRNLHQILVFFMSSSMHSIIVKNTLVSNKYVMKFALIGHAFIIGEFIIFIIIQEPEIIDQACLFSVNESSYVWVLISLFIKIMPSVYICCHVFVMNWRVRKVLKAEAEYSNLQSANKRYFAKRILGYGLIFTLFFVPFIVIMFLDTFKYSTNAQFILNISLFCFSWYPFFDSAIYGCSKSFKRNIFNLCIRNPEFDQQEETLHYLREQNIIRPRFYLDLIDQSESFAG